MRRFFVEGLTTALTEVAIAGDEFNHLKKVLRLKAGDEVSVFDGKGLELTGRLTAVGKDSAVMAVQKGLKFACESEAGITLYQGLLKGDKPEFIIQKATELGVKSVVFYTSERTVPSIETKEEARLSRWRKVAVEAAKQCGRTVLPELKVTDYSDALTSCGSALKLLLWEDEEKEGIKGLVKPAIKDIAVIVGPEGGISPEDVSIAKTAGFIPVSLGPRVLRSETAAVSIISILQYELGDMDSPRKFRYVDF